LCIKQQWQQIDPLYLNEWSLFIKNDLLNFVSNELILNIWFKYGFSLKVHVLILMVNGNLQWIIQLKLLLGWVLCLKIAIMVMERDKAINI
jgi:hypothetical protein